MVDPKTRSFSISRQADAFIRSLPDKRRTAVKKAIKKLIDNDVAGLDIKRLLPHPHEFRLRVGKVRVLFKSTSEQLFIFKAHYRGQAYKR
ncbi:MAG: hypothetical protein JXL84_05340 [Deltaproteobacteria bacterium]|nr:hypothetical protein [Deltaproteobacteria bacterium]